MTKKARKFVKYANRKIHEEGSEVPYVSMKELGRIVAEGDDVQVVDDGTGEDLTLVTLARVAYELSKGAVKTDELAAVEVVADLLLGEAKRRRAVGS